MSHCEPGFIGRGNLYRFSTEIAPPPPQKLQSQTLPHRCERGLHMDVLDSRFEKKSAQFDLL